MSLKNLDEYLQYDLRIKAIGMLLVKSLIHILTLLNLELFIKLRYIRSRTSADFDISDTILLTYIVAGIYSLGKFDISGTSIYPVFDISGSHCIYMYIKV